MYIEALLRRLTEFCADKSALLFTFKALSKSVAWHRFDNPRHCFNKTLTDLSPAFAFVIYLIAYNQGHTIGWADTLISRYMLSHLMQDQGMIYQYSEGYKMSTYKFISSYLHVYC